MSEEIIRVLRPGASIRLNGTIPAKILSVSIRPGRTAYECSWWCDGRYLTEYFERFEFEMDAGDSMEIGFQ